MIDIPLRKACSQWEARRDLLVRGDDWLQRKTDRLRRLGEISEYVKTNCPEIMKTPKGLVVDIGPGPGEFLEIARHYGHEVFGVDAETGTGGMGNKYLDLSRLMTERQRVNVEYCGFEFWLTNIFTHGTYEWRELASSCVLINSRGSIEQSMSAHMEGIPHHVHHDCKQLAWKDSGETRDAFGGMFAKFKRLVKPGGHVLIHANGSANDKFYDEVVCESAERNAFKLVGGAGLTLHKWARLWPGGRENGEETTAGD